MPTPPKSAGSFLASLAPDERALITDVQDKLRAERSLGVGPQDTIELPLALCQETIALHRAGKVSAQGAKAAVEWALHHPEKVDGMASVVDQQGLVLMHRRGDALEELSKFAHQHDAWRDQYAQNPEKAVQDACNMMLVSSRGLVAPAQIRQAVDAFFQDGNEPSGLQP